MSAPQRRILVCDDESQILRALRVILRDAGFAVLPASTAQEALDAAAVQAPDAAIIDLVLPDGDGVSVTRSLREWSSVPIIVLSAIGEEGEKVRALEAGADDYVTKPFAPRELVARLEAGLRRATPGDEGPVLRAGALELDLAAHIVTVEGNEVHLTKTEFRLLKALMRSRGRLLTHAALLREVWGPAYEDDVATLRTHIANLRRKVEPPEASGNIKTEPGIGYRFAHSPQDSSRQIMA
jgi:two-component system, OmpR family, KDP operon response regulator KdpE